MAYKVPKTIWELGATLSFEEPLDADDERFVDTEGVRGEFNYKSLLRPLGVNSTTYELMFEPKGVYSLFCGHRGCGKSTELRRLADRLNNPENFFVVSLDATNDLDINNLQYTDVLLTLARALLDRLEEAGVEIEQVFLSRLERWFQERIEKHEKTKEYASEIKAGAKGKVGIPFLGVIFAGLTNSFKVNSTYKEELRTIIRNSYSDFAESFQQLIDAANDRIKANGSGKALLFVIDGTDRLSGEDSDRFFIHDAHQLQQVQGNFIYCAPIHLIYESNQVQEIFSNIFKLPMIKLEDKYERTPIEEAYKAMRELVYRRADRGLFDSEETVDYLIANSGGHPRDLLHLLIYAFKNAEGEKFDRASAEAAVKELATDYRRILDKDDFDLLRQIDSAPEGSHNSERARHLLYHLALLEYNSYWWRSHPVVRTLPGYRDPSVSER